MKNFQATAVEKRVKVTGDFFSQPMEAGWASEALFFLWVEEVTALEQPLDIAVQLSADGMNWIDEGTVLPGVQAAGHYFVRVKHFGNWLRLAVKTSRSATVKLSVYLHLKG
ncbi:MAG: DUF6385 domain-containing protein [Niabella sp.]